MIKISVENFDNVIGLSCKLIKKKAECKLLELTGWEEFPKVGHRDIHGLIPHIEKYGIVAERTVDSMHIYSPDKLHVKSVGIGLLKEDRHIQILFEATQECVIAPEKERGKFLTCPAYLYSKNDKRLE